MNPTVSVIMPVYNAERYLAESIESILAQTYSDWELILIDDGSVDESRAIARKYAVTDDRIHFYDNKENLGVAKTRNKALGFATGVYVSPLDHDDVAAPDRLLAQVRFLEANPDHALVASNLNIIDENSKLIGVRKYPESDREIHRCITRMNPVANPASMFRRSVFDELGGKYDESVCPVEDYDFVVRVAKKYKITNLQERLTSYRITTTQAKSLYVKKTLRLTLFIQKRAIILGVEDSFYNEIHRTGLKCLSLFPDWLILKLFKVVSFQKV